MADNRFEEEEEEEKEIIYKRRRLSSGSSSSSQRCVDPFVITSDDEQEEVEVIIPLEQIDEEEEEVILPLQEIDDEDRFRSDSELVVLDSDEEEAEEVILPFEHIVTLQNVGLLDSDDDDDEEEVIYKRRHSLRWFDDDDEDDDDDDDDEQQQVTVFPASSELTNHNVFTVINDPQVFDCPICLDQLFAPVFQCDNGHIACSSCCSKLKTRCPFCCLSIHTRCSGLENFLQSFHILCKYAHNSCTNTMPYPNKIDHEQVCQHVTCFCPYPSCSYAHSSWLVYRHFHIQHPLSATRFTYNTTFSVSVEINQNQIFLQERRGSVVFILHHEVLQNGGRAFYVDCVGPKHTLKNMFVYHLAAESIDMDTSLTFKSVPEVHTQLPKHTFTESYLTVPSAFAAGDNGILSLSVCIKKDDPVALEVQKEVFTMHDRDVLKVVLNDPATLDCSVCLEPLWNPVFQCENAHLVCSSCCSKLKSKCSCCGYYFNRCRGLEKVIESIGKISCKYAKYGCKKTNPYNEKTQHEKDCPRATCFCPHLSSCSFSGSYENLYHHFGIKHADDITRFAYNTTFSLCVDIIQEHVFLQAQSGSVILILSHRLEKQGRVFYIDCVGTRAVKQHIVYTLTAKSMETSRTLKCVPDIYTKWSKHNEPGKNHLTVPPDFAGYDGILSLSICITTGLEALKWILEEDHREQF